MGISLLMLSLSVAVPLLERFELVDQPVVESEHNPATCPPAHDHTVCTQVSANLSAPSAAQEQRLGEAVVVATAMSEAPEIVSAAFEEGHPSRAPPLT